MSQSRRFMMTAATVALMLGAGGCVDRDVVGDESTYSYSWWVPVLTLLAALAAFPLGLVLRANRKWAKAGTGLLILSPLVALVFVPSLFHERVKVDSRHFETRAGLWLMSTRHEVPFDGLTEIRHVTYETRGRRGRKTTKHKLVCLRAGGAYDTVQLSNLARRAVPEILSRARERGIAATDTRE